MRHFKLRASPESRSCRRRLRFGGFLQKVEFSLADGSALIKRLRRLGLFRWIPQNLTYQILLAVLIAWVPLLIFTAHDGLALSDKIQIPFLADLVQYARFFVALPCALALGKFLNPRLRSVLNSFLRGGIVSSKDFARFENAILRATALTNSMIAELVILALVYFYTSLGLHRDVSTGISSWHHSVNGALLSETLADWWFLWVSMPLLLFAWFLWALRLGVWAYLLFRISRLELRLVATHPDRVGGLNFINVGMRRFSVLVFAISSILCASIGEEILCNGASLGSYELELALFFLICLAVILGPLMVFTPMLIRSKLKYWASYGPLASSYVQGFDEKWILETGYARQNLLGSPDIQSLADLRNSYAGISEMRTLLPNRTTVGILAIAYILPALPLLASVFSLRRVLSEVFTLLLK
jgi:hypothetical protein